jgi:hypothetical protein
LAFAKKGARRLATLNLGWFGVLGRYVGASSEC